MGKLVATILSLFRSKSKVKPIEWESDYLLDVYYERQNVQCKEKFRKGLSEQVTFKSSKIVPVNKVDIHDIDGTSHRDERWRLSCQQYQRDVTSCK